jgi:1-phosphofructokinase
MIYTVTFNPSLDYIVTIDDFRLGKTNRTTSELMLPSGKGLNVTTVLHNLGIENIAFGFTAGFVGEEIKRRAKDAGLVCDFIDIPNGVSRINVKMKDFDGTEINGMGPVIDESSQKLLMEKLELLKEGDTLVLAGSIPTGMSKSIYSDILKALDGRGIRFVVDATKELLLNVLAYHPFLIKPNNHELGELFDVIIEKKEQVEPYARKLQEMGAKNVLVSMAGEGAVLLDEHGKIYLLDAPKGTLVNAVGAGDSMVAGFLAGWDETEDYEHAFKMAVCAGSASAFSELYATKEEVEKLYQSMCE